MSTRFGWLLLAAGCADDPTADGRPYEALLAGAWAGSAVAVTGSYNATADFAFDDGDQTLGGRASIDNYLFDIRTTSSDPDAATLELLDGNSIARLVLIAHLDGPDAMSGHFEMNLCFSNDPSGAAPGCTVGGSYTLQRR